MSFINKKAIRDYVNKHGRRAGADFLHRIEFDLVHHLEEAVHTKDGGKKTIGTSVSDWIGLKYLKYMPREKKKDE